MGKDAYQALTSRFEGSGGLPLPPGKNGPLTEWFKYWLTEEEAEFLRQLPWLIEPATLEAIAAISMGERLAFHSRKGPA